VMIVTRGGGSLEDLWPFNEEVVARAIFESEIPIISAVGHEIDFTISDFVADFRAPTPSAAAELVIPRKEELVGLIGTATTRLNNALAGKVNRLAERLAAVKDSYILRQPLNLIVQYEQQIDGLRKDVAIRIEHLIKMRGENYNLLTSKLEAFNPLAILKRGYSVTTKLPEGIILKDIGLLKVGDTVETKLGKGKFRSKVEEIENG